MADKAMTYLRALRWRPPIEAAYLAGGVGKVVAVFLFEFAEKIGGQ